ncbi:MAG: hypothetical protein NC321_16085 [Clostridium sp.]|nr:hypothetical protein [Lachnospiraceae bacterium]MCM1254338.1 hypothetical protein [Clostridium sp.]
MGNEMDFENIEESFVTEYSPSFIMHDKDGELIQRLDVSHLANIAIDYKNKVFHAEYQADKETRGFKNGYIFDIPFDKLVIA